MEHKFFSLERNGEGEIEAEGGGNEGDKMACVKVTDTESLTSLNWKFYITESTRHKPRSMTAVGELC